ncbi:hypothetical protein QUB07_11295 [Microcoleus sp. F8-C5]
MTVEAKRSHTIARETPQRSTIFTCLPSLKRAVFIQVGDNFSSTDTSKIRFFEIAQASEVSAG